MRDTFEYPLHRPELYEALALGDRKLLREMGEQTKVLRPDERLIRTGEALQWVYHVRTGWLMRSRPVEAGHRQIITLSRLSRPSADDAAATPDRNRHAGSQRRHPRC
jgi:CRP-like cAMP-binding protein